MSDPVMASVATGVSVCLLVLLIRRDPMRLRVAARGRISGAVGWRPWQRLLLTGGALAPGALLVFFGRVSTVLVWFGALLVSGWIATALAAPRADARTRGERRRPRGQP